jgi:PAS domain S-box-containing protein
MKSQEKYLTILNNISDGVYVLNTDGYFTFVNQAIIDGSGIPSEKFYTLHYLDIVDPEYHDQAKRNFQRVMKGEEGIPYELRYTSFNGQIRIVEVHSKPIYDQGKINGLQGISRDITERRRAEEVLRRSEEKYRTVLNNASDAIVLGDEQGNLLEVNRKAEGLFGYPREELLRMHYTELHPTIELETTVAAHRDIVTHGKGGLQKGVVLRKDGTVVPVDITATAIEYNGMRILQASFRDISDHKQTEDTLERLIRERTVELSEKNKQLVEEITERKQMEEEIKKERETFFTVLKNYPHGVALVDRNGVNQYVNPEFTEITGYTIEDIPTGRDWFQKAYPVREYRKKVINAWKADRVKTGIGVDRHFSITCKDGHVKDIEFRITFLENWSITVLNDITARKRAEEALKKRDRELEVKSRTLTEMNAALKILLKQREKDKDEVEANVLSHVKQLVMPYMEKLKKCRIGAKEKGYVSILESTMKEIVSPFSNKLSSKYLNLTPKEIEIANLIKEGKTTKEIGELSNVSPGTVAFHRNNIRIKLNLKNKKDNLRSYLLTLS